MSMLVLCKLSDLRASVNNLVKKTLLLNKEI
jgi:hypothetical protein